MTELGGLPFFGSSLGQHVSNLTIGEGCLTEALGRIRTASDLTKMLELVRNERQSQVGSVQVICKRMSKHVGIEVPRLLPLWSDPTKKLGHHR
ncbi:hypothetical protein D3C86_1013690 [compost metagenome]